MFSKHLQALMTPQPPYTGYSSASLCHLSWPVIYFWSLLPSSPQSYK